MKLNKNEILTALQADFKAAETLQKDTLAKVDQWRREFNGEAYGNEVKGKSQIVSKDIKKQAEWLHPSLLDPFVNTQDIVKVNPITWEDENAARQSELLLNYQFCRQFDRYNFMSKALKILQVEGTLVVQVGWDYQDEEVEVMKEVVYEDEEGNQFIAVEEGTEIKVIKNQPTAVVCRNEDVFIDPTCMDDMDKCQFVVHRYESDYSTLKQDGRYKNLEKVMKDDSGESSADPDFDSEDETEFRFADKARKKLLVHEYWGNYDVDGDGIAEPIVCAWIGKTIVRLESNPYPDQKPPFLVVPFNSVPFQIYGESDAELISDNQKIKTAVTRGIIDNMAQSNNGQIGVRKGALPDMANRKKFLEGKNFEFAGTPNDFWYGSYNQIPSSAFDMLAVQNNEIESLTAVKSFSGGLTGQSLGNMLDISTDIPIIDGSWKKLVDIVDGDVIVGSDGKGTTVLKAHEIKFPETAYDMAFDNGSVVKSGGEHLWTVKVYGTKHALREWTTMDADEIYNHMQKGRRVVIPAIKEVRTGTPTGNSIDPYVLGFWLGDGMSHSSRITCADDEVVKYFDEAGYKCVEVKDSSKCGKATMYDVYKKGTKVERDSGGFVSNGSLHSELRELGLHAKYGGEKHIPEEYFTATYEEKMELIRGLMDSDGYQHSGSFVQFAQSEGRLKKDFIKLIESLGLKVSIRVRTADTMNKRKLAASEKTSSRMIWARKDAYEIGFTPWTNPFKLKRKANNWKKPKIQTVRLKSMEVVDKVLMRCLTVDSKDKLFAVTDRFTLTHNTATGTKSVLDASAVRRLNRVRNIAENLVKPLMRKWLAYSHEFLEDEQIVRVTNDELAPVRRDDLAGLVDLEITISTAEDNGAKAEQLSFLLQTLGNTMPFELSQKVLAEIARLNRMPALEKQIAEFKQEPDPAAEQAKQLELQKLMLENKKLMAEIEAIMKQATEDMADTRKKNADAALKEAQARKYEEEADMTSLKFLKEESEYDRKLRDYEFEKKRLHDMEMALLQMKAGDSNVGLPR